MIPDPSGAADAVILVDDAGAVTLFIGEEADPRAEAATNTTVIRILAKYAAQHDRVLTVATHYPSGYRTLHRVHPDGTVTAATASPARVTASPAPDVAAPATATAGSAARPTAILGTAALLAMVFALTGSGAPPADMANTSQRTEAMADGLIRLSPNVPADTPALPVESPSATLPPTPQPTKTPKTPSPTGSPSDDPGENSTDGPGDETSQPPSPPDSEQPPAPPTRPGGLGVADRTGTSLTVSWQPSTAELGITGYAVYLDGTRTDTVSGNRAVVSGLRSAESYVISVAAIDGGGSIGSRASVTARTVDIEPPSSPANPTIADRTGTSLTVSWRPASDNVGVTGYTVYVDGRRATSVNGTTATVGGLSPATSYTVSVAAVDAAGNLSGQASSSGKTADTIPPSRPGDLDVRVAITAAVLDWSRSTDNVGVSGYAVYLDGRRVMKTSGTTATLEDLQGATVYTFSVAAYDAAGNLGPKISVQMRTMAGA